MASNIPLSSAKRPIYLPPTCSLCRLQTLAHITECVDSNDSATLPRSAESVHICDSIMAERPINRASVPFGISPLFWPTRILPRTFSNQCPCSWLRWLPCAVCYPVVRQLPRQSFEESQHRAAHRSRHPQRHPGCRLHAS